MFLLPFFDKEKKLCNGSLIKSFPFCKKNYQRGICKEFYNGLFENNKDGFYICPYGLTACIKTTNNKKNIFTSIKDVDTYSHKNKKFISEKTYNVSLSKEQINILINNSLSEEYLIKKNNEDKTTTDTMLHELRKLNAQIKEHCDSLFAGYLEKRDVYTLLPEEYFRLFERIKTLYVISTMINTRYSLYSYEQNSETITQGTPIKTNVYKKFDKCRWILKNYQKKNVFIDFLGQSYKGIMAYPLFEMIPFLLLENAIKYSPEEKKIVVSFLFTGHSLSIKIESYGPCCSNEEIDHLIDKGFRGENARKKADGTGIGLYFVNVLCKIHNIKINFESKSDNKFVVQGITYSPFVVELFFDNVFDMLDES